MNGRSHGAEDSPVRAITFPVLALLLGLAPAAASAGAPPVTCDLALNGNFRFLTSELPNGTRNAEYVARVATANADGPVTFSADVLPPGLVLDPESGFITGIPTENFSEDITLTANDGVQSIQTVIHLFVNAAGGGGNGGASFGTTSLAAGRVGEFYTQTVTSAGGVGPFVYGAVDLPPGLTLNGLTGVVSGVPTSPGTFYASFTIYDGGESNTVVGVLPIEILPATSDFRFLTEFLNNGEVGTPYCDTWLTENAAGAVTYGASGLPLGLAVDPATGVVSGAPLLAGTFVVVLSASDGANTVVTNLSMMVAPNAGSTLHWNYFGIPTGFVNVSYDRQPPILVAAEGAPAITYSAIGAPTGILYDANSGELSGTPIEIGEWPMTFTATDTATQESIVLSIVFLVLPPSGGDASQISVNFWVTKESLESGVPGRDSWRASTIYNADRRAANRYDPLTDPLSMQIGSRTVMWVPGTLAGTEKTLSARSANGVVPVEQVKLGPAKQTLSWVTKNDTLAEAVPGILTQIVTIGNRGYRLLLSFDENGAFHPALDFERTAFVVRTGKIAVKGAGDDGAKLSLLLADPNFGYDAGLSTLRFRLLDGDQVLFDRDFTALGGEAKVTTDDRTGALVFSVKTLEDDATADRIAKFSYASGKGTMRLALADADLSGIPPGEAHLGVELTIGARTYYTAVTFFERKTGSYSTTMP
jgi:hypothetical protein